jgi:UDP-N-acetylglucosamine 2-epimerase (non-hydrolysing)
MVVVGTRPEAIKMAPVISALRASRQLSCRVVATAQHRDMLDQALRLFHIEPDMDLDVMQSGQSLTSLTARLLSAFESALDAYLPDAVLAQGDTTTVLAVALACFYRRIPFGHVEAGLRTGDLSNPFPEEANRSLAAKLARWHFAPTAAARQNLLREGVPEADIHVTGNTVIDALLSVAAQPAPLPFALDAKSRLILVTAHRRESFGEPLRTICRAILTLLQEFPDLTVVFPVHPNPHVQDTVKAALGGHARVLLCAPLDYRTFVAVMQAAYLILSDSGGVQEEAPALGKPVLVLRRETERPEAIAAGVVQLVGTGHDAIVAAVRSLCTDRAAYAAMAKGVSPYGDGLAAGRIVQVLESHFQP